MKRSFILMSIVWGLAASAAQANLYDLNGTTVEVDAWYGSGSNESLIVIDWNDTNGPYVTESHAWGYRWTGSSTIKEALLAIEAGSALTLEYAYGGGFVKNAWYDDGTDNHTTDTYDGWVWSGTSTNGGASYALNGDGVDVELLIPGGIEAINWNPGDWTIANFTLPVPEPASMLLMLGAMVPVLTRRRKSYVSSVMMSHCS